MNTGGESGPIGGGEGGGRGNNARHPWNVAENRYPGSKSTIVLSPVSCTWNVRVVRGTRSGYDNLGWNNDGRGRCYEKILAGI